ncbi:helix-turn-helix domain-containing protein [Flavobacterium phragmitis]|uniref:Transcriptional regulator, contains XRE-family HTH domain n=1 Tax=Flavobacterium phragmitis TaxID=739143 RepID=A0A1I1S7M8_9FLAO|nr:helix-turn-helix transcriptional regulator [Flavobacterium phragmitis]SFD40598.1 Transcriptional regulator, contains XRE-family HTH domain [Flavobacterium phragmitis]
MNRIVGNKLRILRKAKNLSQEEVADYLNVSPSAYARMERGESTSWANHFNKICEVFEIAPEELVRKEIGDSAYENIINTEQATYSDYRKIIKHYKLKIKDLKIIMKSLGK